LRVRLMKHARAILALYRLSLQVLSSSVLKEFVLSLLASRQRRSFV